MKCESPLLLPHKSRYKKSELCKITENLVEKAKIAFPSHDWDNFVAKKICNSCKNLIYRSYDKIIARAAVSRIRQHQSVEDGETGAEGGRSYEAGEGEERDGGDEAEGGVEGGGSDDAGEGEERDGGDEAEGSGEGDGSEEAEEGEERDGGDEAELSGEGGRSDEATGESAVGGEVDEGGGEGGGVDEGGGAEWEGTSAGGSQTSFPKSSSSTSSDKRSETQKTRSSSASTLSSESRAPSSIPPYQKRLDKEKAIEEFNKTILEPLGETPVTKTKAHRPRDLREKAQKAVKALKTRFSSLAEGHPDMDASEPCGDCEQLLVDLKKKYKEAESKIDKYKILTCAPRSIGIRGLMKHFTVSQVTADKAVRLREENGALSFPSFKLGRPLSNELVKLVRNFYLVPANSRVSAGQRDTINVKDDDGAVIRVAKHRMLVNAKDLYLLFCKDHDGDENKKISISTFMRLRPKQCVWPGVAGFHVQCVCVIHENFRLLLAAVKKNQDTKPFLKSLLCTEPTRTCWLSLCQKCPTEAVIDKFCEGLDDEGYIDVCQWNKTDYSDLSKLTWSVPTFKTKLKESIPGVLEHELFTSEQQRYFHHLKSAVLPGSNKWQIVSDFSQNYSVVVQNAVYGIHWSATQVTVHPFALTKYNVTLRELETSHTVIISDELKHDAVTFSVFRKKLLVEVLFPKYGKPDEIIYISDGAGSQYKNKINLANCMLHEREFGVKNSWIFSTTAHGKNTCDAIGAVVKRTTRLESLKNHGSCSSVETMFHFLNDHFKDNPKLDFLFVSTTEVANERAIAEERYKPFRSIPGTRRFHSFTPIDGNKIRAKFTSLCDDYYDFDFLVEHAYFVKPTELIIGDFYAFYEDHGFKIGMLVAVENEEEGVEVQCMSIAKNGNCRWPSVPVKLIISPIMIRQRKFMTLFSFDDHTYDRKNREI